eukprot:320769-Prymnesium_polylepis.1
MAVGAYGPHGSPSHTHPRSGHPAASMHNTPTATGRAPPPRRAAHCRRNTIIRGRPGQGLATVQHNEQTVLRAQRLFRGTCNKGASIQIRIRVVRCGGFLAADALWDGCIQATAHCRERALTAV